MKRVLLLLLLLVACVPPQPVDVSNVTSEVPEKVVEKVVVQCWDNSTASSLEECPEKVVSTPVKIVVEEPVQNVPIARKFLNEAKAKFTGFAYVLEDRLVVQRGDKVRHMFFKLSSLDDRTPVTDVFVDLSAKSAVAYCNVEREGRIEDDSFEFERSRCKDYIDKEIPVAFDKWVPVGPLEYLERYADLEPILVEDNLQTISIGGNSKSIQPSLHYMVDGKRHVLRIDKRYQVPLKIELEGGGSIDFRDAYFDVMVVYGKQEKITDDWLTYTPVSEYWKAAASK